MLHLLICALMLVLAHVVHAAGPATTQESHVLPSAGRLPVGKESVWTAVDTGGVGRQATMRPLPSGGFVMVFAQYRDGDVDSSRLMQSWSLDGRSLTAPRPLSFGGPLEDAPVFATIGDDVWLYFASSDTDLQRVQLWRAQLRTSEFAAPERLDDVEGLDVGWVPTQTCSSPSAANRQGRDGPTAFRIAEDAPSKAMLPAATAGQRRQRQPVAATEMSLWIQRWEVETERWPHG